MVDGLDKLDLWPDTVKEAQRGWIGRSFGSKISFKSTIGDLQIFTTRPETIFGVSFLAVSFENLDLINRICERNPTAKFVVENYLESLN
jgi:leucyl-tRNA synthetase